MIAYRICTACKIEKEETTVNFYKRGKSSIRKDGTIPFHPECKTCAKERVKAISAAKYKCPEEKAKKQAYRKKHSKKLVAQAKAWKEDNPDKALDSYLKRRYGITLVDYTTIEAEQKFKCKICRTSDFSEGRGSRMVVDHCHKTGEVRGLLCHSCNVGLGNFKDDPRVLKKAIKYLYGE